jgi:hypothetical protein
MTKLEVGATNHPLEREADEIADRVMQMAVTHPPPSSARSLISPSSPDPQVVRRTCNDCGSPARDEDEPTTGADTVRRTPADVTRANLIRRSCPKCEAENENESENETLWLRRGALARGGGINQDFAGQLQDRIRGGGNPLSASARGFLEPRLGVGLGEIRTHTDAASGTLAQRINARAFTLGQHVFFAPNELHAHTRDGMHLLTHEIAHTMQTSGHASLQRQILRKEADCAKGDGEPEELANVKQQMKPLSRWLEKVKTKDLRHDMLRGIRSLRARRVCLAASCGLDGFNLDMADKQKLACFDEAQEGGEIAGICYKKFNVKCPTGPAAPLQWRREAAIRKAVQYDLAEKEYPLPRDKVKKPTTGGKRSRSQNSSGRGSASSMRGALSASCTPITRRPAPQRFTVGAKMRRSRSSMYSDRSTTESSSK